MNVLHQYHQYADDCETASRRRLMKLVYKKRYIFDVDTCGPRQSSRRLLGHVPDD